MDGLLSTGPACEYNIICVCCSGKSEIIHMIPIFNNNVDVPEIKISYLKLPTVKISYTFGTIYM